MGHSTETMARDHARVRSEAEAVAGGLADLAQRAMVYHHLFRHSGRNHAFPLLAAHGALWGRGYFRTGRRVGGVVSMLDMHRPTLRAERLAALAVFADAFREINRRVCVEVYASYHFAAAHGEDAGAEAFVEPVILDALNRCHHARRRGAPLTAGERRELFETFFRWEQRAVVGPAVDAAVAAFDWPRVRALALRPTIRFAYIPARDALRFANFADVDERIVKGLEAHRIAEAVGLDAVETALSRYGVLPIRFLDVADEAFAALSERLSSRFVADDLARRVLPT